MGFEATGWKCTHPRNPWNILHKPYRRAQGRVVRYEQCRTCHKERQNRYHHANRETENFKRKLREAGVDATQVKGLLNNCEDRSRP